MQLFFKRFKKNPFPLRNSNFTFKNDKLMTSYNRKLNIFQINLWQNIKNYYLLSIQTYKEIYNDYRYCNTIEKKIKNSDLLSIREITFYNENKKEIRKIPPIICVGLLPFSVFIFLPSYFLLFPNSFPKKFYKLIPIEIEKKLSDKLEKNRKEEYHFLKFILDIKNLELREYTTSELVKLSKFLSNEIIIGTRILNILARISLYLPKIFISLLIFNPEKRNKFKNQSIFKNKIAMDFFPFDNLKKKLLINQIELFLEELLLEDNAIKTNGFDIVIEKELKIFSEKRCLKIENSENFEKIINQSCQLDHKKYIKFILSNYINS